MPNEYLTNIDPALHTLHTIVTEYSTEDGAEDAFAAVMAELDRLYKIEAETKRRERNGQSTPAA